MDSRGSVYYTDLNQVWKILPDGKKTVAVPNVHTHELYLDNEDNLYGEHLWYEGEADLWRHRVWCLTTDGALIDIIPEREGFRQNFSFVRDAENNMYWAEPGSPTVIRKRTPDGDIKTHFAGAFRDVTWMTCTRAGTLFLIDDGGLVRISPDSTRDILASDLRERKLSQFHVDDRHILMGLWTDQEGNVYVAVYGGRMVKKITPQGQISVVAESPIPWGPTGGFVAPNGDLWLLEYSLTNSVRVRRISKDGAVKIY